MEEQWDSSPVSIVTFSPLLPNKKKETVKSTKETTNFSLRNTNSWIWWGVTLDVGKYFKTQTDEEEETMRCRMIISIVTLPPSPEKKKAK